MKSIVSKITLMGLLYLVGVLPVWALEGNPYIHDPSTIMECDGKFYTYGTGGGGLVSSDGWTWTRGAERPGGGLAPDAIKLGDRYYLSYTSKGGGLAGGHSGAINTMWSLSLDPNSPDFGFHDDSVVVTTDGVEDCDAIDPGFFLDPVTGRLWLTYGTYFGFIRQVELDPQTCKRINPADTPRDIAIDCEATVMIYRNGWYYLLGTHGTCCSGVNSTYNIRVGRSRSVNGPFVDNMGIDMLRGGGKLLIAANGRNVGPGHFGLIDLGGGAQRFSMHYEADLDQGGRSVLAIRSLLWKNDWPMVGEDFQGGTFVIESERSGYVLDLAVEATPLAQVRRRGFGRRNTGPVTPIADQEVDEVSKSWPQSELEVRLSDYMLQAHQQWTITPVKGAGGYLGSPYFKIVIAGTQRALAATTDAEVVAVPAFTGESEQLWRIEQLTDGTYRLIPKVVHDYPLALTAVGVSTPSLTEFDPESDKGRWNLKVP